MAEQERQKKGIGCGGLIALAVAFSFVGDFLDEGGVSIGPVFGLVVFFVVTIAFISFIRRIIRTSQAKQKAASATNPQAGAPARKGPVPSIRTPPSQKLPTTAPAPTKLPSQATNRPAPTPSLLPPRQPDPDDQTEVLRQQLAESIRDVAKEVDSGNRYSPSYEGVSSEEMIKKAKRRIAEWDLTHDDS